MRARTGLLVLATLWLDGPAWADTPERVRLFVAQCDADQNGKISLAEFRAHSVRLAGIRPSQAMIGDTFYSYDLNHDGFITAREMQTINLRANLEMARLQGSNGK